MNQDYQKRFPNQNADRRETECEAETIADLVGNIQRIPCTPDYSYAVGLRMMNIPPNTGGLDPLAGMQGAVVYGVCPADNDPLQGELYEANLSNYSPEEKAKALSEAQKGVVTLRSWRDIINHLDKGIGGVALIVRWYNGFSTPGPSGVLPMPIGDHSFHCVAVYGYDEKGLLIKPLLGSEYGDGGYGHINGLVFTNCFEQAYAFDPFAWRWLSLAGIAVTKPYLIPDILPMLKS